MNLLDVSIIKIAIILCILVSNPSFADEKIDFSSEGVAKEILLNKTWICHQNDTYGKSISKWTFDSVNGNKVTGKVKMEGVPVCSSDSLKGKLKKNIIKYTAVTNTICVAVKGTLNFFRKENGKIIANGFYQFGGSSENGKYTCE